MVRRCWASAVLTSFLTGKQLEKSAVLIIIKSMRSFALSPESLKCAAAIPSELRASSRHLGWTSILLDHHVVGSNKDPFATHPTPDQTIIVLVRGNVELETQTFGTWRKRPHLKGAVGLTPGGSAERYRRQSIGKMQTFETLNVHVASTLLENIADEHRRAGSSPPPPASLSALAFDDPLVYQTASQLMKAVHHGASDLYAEAVAIFLGTHLLTAHTPWFGSVSRQRDPGAVSDRRMNRVLDFIAAHYSEPISLGQLANEAGVSKFHFVTLFRRLTGTTPHAYLTGVRLNIAERMLKTTDLSIAEVSFACGYEQPTTFARAFSLKFGNTPREYRRRARV